MCGEHIAFFSFPFISSRAASMATPTTISTNADNHEVHPSNRLYLPSFPAHHRLPRIKLTKTAGRGSIQSPLTSGGIQGRADGPRDKSELSEVGWAKHVARLQPDRFCRGQGPISTSIMALSHSYVVVPPAGVLLAQSYVVNPLPLLMGMDHHPKSI